MATNLILASALFIVLSCSNNNDKRYEKSSINDTNDKYAQRIIDSLNVRQQYDSARWLVYERQSRDTLEWSVNNNEMDRFTLGELSLDLDTIEIRNDTINFNFCYSKQPNYTCKDVFVGNECIIIGVGVNFNNKELLYYKTACNFDVLIDEFLKEKIRKERILFRNYVKNNFERLDPWFRSEVLKRKITDP